MATLKKAANHLLRCAKTVNQMEPMQSVCTKLPCPGHQPIVSDSPLCLCGVYCVMEIALAGGRDDVTWSHIPSAVPTVFYPVVKRICTQIQIFCTHQHVIAQEQTVVWFCPQLVDIKQWGHLITDSEPNSLNFSNALYLYKLCFNSCLHNSSST